MNFSRYGPMRVVGTGMCLLRILRVESFAPVTLALKPWTATAPFASGQVPQSMSSHLLSG